MSISTLPKWAAVPLVAALVTGVAAVAASLPFAFIHFGNFTRMVESGHSGGQVRLADLPQRKGDWGLGATAGLKGEIVQIDGRLLVSPGSDAQGRVQSPQQGEEAVLFVGARVAAWAEVTVPNDMGQAQLESFVREQAAARGLSLEQPFVFRVEGRFPHLMWHVVTGEPSAVGQGLQGQPGGHGGQRGHGAMMAGGHANQQSGMKVFHAPGATGALVGVCSGAGLEGVVSHAGERFHLHYVDSGTTVSGHVDRYAVAAGAVLKLPVP
jgi:alpha-acetolactate decarboxylase